MAIDVFKDASGPRPVPTVWRETLAAIVHSFRNGDFGLSLRMPNVPTLSESVARQIEENIASYGATLAALPEATWSTSVCQWMGNYWDLLVDLYTEEEGSSDLVLSARVREAGSSFSFEVLGIHVP
ncbi:MAG: DUF7668 domain-containing protein [Roseateles sp.]|uniref:DUF7668 domain-containing protein n=1 Tax=Roseateles sp. TaxID=1971397 RepID=UPI00403547D7